MFHPFLRIQARRQAAQELMAKKGIGPFAARREVNRISEEEMTIYMSQASESCGVLPPMENMVGGLGDGTIIQAIIEWLKSDEGKAFIQALLKLLLAALMV